eukprot:1138199-Pelagomonas_calceolata.AAC.9
MIVYDCLKRTKQQTVQHWEGSFSRLIKVVGHPFYVCVLMRADNQDEAFAHTDMAMVHDEAELHDLLHDLPFGNVEVERLLYLLMRWLPHKCACYLMMLREPPMGANSMNVERLSRMLAV